MFQADGHITNNWLSQAMYRYFDRYREDFYYSFVAFQPRNRSLLDAEVYFAPFDDYFDAVATPLRALHHTILNTGSVGAYDRSDIFEFTNALIERYKFSWVVEDVGIWSIEGKTLPYPLAPILTPDGLDACVRNVNQCQKNLAVPLCIEFPGFSLGSSIVLGNMDMFSYFAELARRTASPVTLDVGHLLGWQWVTGRWPERILEGFEQLPLENCFEIHLSGCEMRPKGFCDMHHGVLINEQLIALEWLLEHCPNLKCVTYEDPAFERDGNLVTAAVCNYQRLKTMLQEWSAR